MSGINVTHLQACKLALLVTCMRTRGSTNRTAPAWSMRRPAPTCAPQAASSHQQLPSAHQHVGCAAAPAPTCESQAAHQHIRCAANHVIVCHHVTFLVPHKPCSRAKQRGGGVFCMSVPCRAATPAHAQRETGRAQALIKQRPANWTEAVQQAALSHRSPSPEESRTVAGIR